MKHGMLIIVLMVLLFITILGPNHIKAGDYEIMKVIAVGPASGVGASAPLKWSPDGTKLAFFNRNSLFLSDTLGNYEEITTFDLYPHRYEWLSDNEIIINLTNHSLDPRSCRLVKLDINSGEVIVLEEFLRKREFRKKNDPYSFEGPRLTIEGNVYYSTNVVRSNLIPVIENTEPCPVVLPKSDYSHNNNKISKNKNHFLAWGDDGLYMVSCNLSDSSRIAKKPYNYIPLPPIINKDTSYYIHGGTMYRFEDSTYIVLDTIIPDLPNGEGFCGLLYYSFNPVKPEILGNFGYCTNEEELFRIGTYNYLTNTYTLIDSIIIMEGCLTPAYAPDGNKIAFLQGGKLHILYREFTAE